MSPVIDGLTAERMLEIEAASIVDGSVVGNDLILTKHDGTTIDAGNVRGAVGPAGPASSPPYAIVQRTGQSMPVGYTTVSFNAADVSDVNNWHDPAVNASRITPGVAGVYEVSVYCDWASDSTSRRATLLLVNGVVVQSDWRAMGGESVGTMASHFDGLVLAAGDYVEIQVHQNTAAALVLTTCRATVTKKA